MAATSVGGCPHLLPFPDPRGELVEQPSYIEQLPAGLRELCDPRLGAQQVRAIPVKVGLVLGYNHPPQTFPQLA